MYPPASGLKCASARFRLVSLLLVFSLLLLSVPTQFIQIIPSAKAAVPIPTTSSTTQNFNSIGTSATATLPVDFKADRTTTATASDARKVGNYGAALTTTTHAGGANLATNAGNGIYNFGSGTTTTGGDRAIGFLSSGTATASGNLYAHLVNNTGGGLSGLEISYDVEKYRRGSNSAGFRIQLFYSTDGATWTSAGNGFMTHFGGDADNTGYTTAPGVTVPVNSTLNVTIPASGNFYLAWNYSVSSGTTYSNAQALAVDNISIKGIPSVTPTNPTGVGAANPSSVNAGDATLLTVSVTPGSNPASTAHTVTADLLSIGGSASQQFFDDGTNGDVTPNNNVFSFSATVASGTTGGAKSLPVTITETSPNSRTGSTSISLTVLSPTNPSGTGSASPASVLPGASSTLTVNVTPGTNPSSTGIAVTADLSSIGGSAAQAFSGSGNTFTFSATVANNTAPGAKTLPVTITDAQGRTGSTSIALNVEQPPPPLDHIVISQIYGGGGNANATYRNDYVELYNPSTTTFDLTGWSLQYASATGSGWETGRQPLGGTIAPGEYYLVSLAAGTATTGQQLAFPNGVNVSGDVNLSGTTGKIALVSNLEALSSTNAGCPLDDPDLVDFVGYGADATCREGSANAPGPGNNATAIFRKNNGSTDTNQNGSDFELGSPAPRRTAPIVEIGPHVFSVDPRANNTIAPRDASIIVSFTEPVEVTGQWFNIQCATTGLHNDATVANSSSFRSYTITPNVSFINGEQCTVTIYKDLVRDLDTDDSGANTDNLLADYTWSFSTATGAPPPYTPDVHLAMGNPNNATADLTQPNNYLMEKPEFALSYNRDKGTANWVSWHLSDEWIGSLDRLDTFRPDPAVPADWYRVLGTDYSGSGFDRGHMVPNADRDHQDSRPINQATFLMTNIIPQTPDNNQGPWAAQEGYLRTLLPANEIYIVAGGVGTGGTGSGGYRETIANGKVHVPAHTWKVALVIPKGDNDISRVTASARTIAILMPNVQGIRNNTWESYLTTVDHIESLTGYNFFSNLPDEIENSIEAGVNGNNNPPGTADSSHTTAEDTAVTVTMKAASPSATLTYTVVSGPSNGTLSGSGANRTYTPNANFHGTDSFTFRASDGTRTSNTSTVTILVTAVNDAPAANAQAVTTDANTPASITLVGSDLETPAAGLVYTVTAGPAHGTLSGGGPNLVYTPAANFAGTDGFKFTVTDTGDGSAAPLSSSEATVSITVKDTVAPTISCPANISVAGNVTSSCAATVNAGAPAATDNVAVASVVGVRSDGLALNAPYPQGITTITWTATDTSGNQSSCVQQVEVTNPAPVVTITGPAGATVYSKGTTVNFAGSYTDNPGGAHTATWTLQSGTQTITVPGVIDPATGAVTASHTFNTTGVYLVKLTVTDGCGGTGAATQINGANMLVAIFDRAGGSVSTSTKAPTISSPAGAFAANPTLTGTATTGFNAAYSSTGSVPTGLATFNFAAANLNFASTGYQWMAVTRPHVWLRGSGTVNNQSGFEFLIAAVDGQLTGGGGADKFRIRIWRKSDGAVIYDNLMGGALNATAAQNTLSGDIAIK